MERILREALRRTKVVAAFPDGESFCCWTGRTEITGSDKVRKKVDTTSGDETLAELAQQYGVHPNQIQGWKKRLMSEAENVFGSGNAHTGSGSEEEIEKLHAKIGELTMEKDFLSKVLGRKR